MLTRFQVTSTLLARLLDATLIGAAWLASFWLRFYVPVIAVTKGFPAFSTYAAVAPLVVVLWGVIFEANGVYTRSREGRRESTAVLLLRGHGMALLCFVALTYVFSEYRYSRVVLVLFGILGAVAVATGRVVMRALLTRLRRHGFQSSRVLLVGVGHTLEVLADRIADNVALGLEVTGVLVPDAGQWRNRRERVLGHLGDVARAVHETRADKVLIALPRQQWAELDRILSRSRTTRSTFRSSPIFRTTRRSAARWTSSRACRSSASTARRCSVCAPPPSGSPTSCCRRWRSCSAPPRSCWSRSP